MKRALYKLLDYFRHWLPDLTYLRWGYRTGAGERVFPQTKVPEN